MNKDYIDVKDRKRSTKEKLRQELIQEEQRCNKLKVPFCFRCAKLDYEDLYNKTILEAQRKEGNVKEEDLKVPKINLKKYSDKNRFKLISETEVWDRQRGSSEPKHIGYNVSYVCNERGCGHSMFMNLEQYDKFKGVKGNKTLISE